MPDFSDTNIQLWPLLIGWSIVTLLYLFGWKRQAYIATAGMLIVSYAVISVAMKGL